MFTIQAAIKYTEKNIGRYLFLGAIGLVIVVTSVISCRISNAGLNNIAVVDTIELACDVNINDSNEICIYKLTVAGYLGTGKEFSEDIPPVVSRSFDLIIAGTIVSIENIVLFVYIHGSAEAVKYHFAYAVLEEIDIGSTINESKSIELPASLQ